MILKLTPLDLPTKSTARSQSSIFIGHHSNSWNGSFRRSIPSSEFHYFCSVWTDTVASDFEMSI